MSQKQTLIVGYKKKTISPLTPYSETISGIKSIADYYSNIDELEVLFVKASSDNTGKVYIGNDMDQTVEIDPGETFTFLCVKPKDFWIKASNQKVMVWGFR